MNDNKISPQLFLPDSGSTISSILGITVEGLSQVEGKFLEVTLQESKSFRTLAIANQEFSCNGIASFVLHTHLLENTSFLLKVHIQDSNKTSYFSLERTYLVRNHGTLAKKVKKSLQDRGKCIFEPGLPDSSLYDYRNTDLRPWFDRDDAKEHIKSRLKSKAIDESTAEWLSLFIEQGYVIFENLIDDKHIHNINLALDDAIDKEWQGYKPYSSQRIEGLHNEHEAIQRLWMHPEILRRLAIIFEEEPVPCQTLSYICGSEQDAHQDTVHLTSFPAGYMCGVWVALEDVKPGSGELFYYPRSHRFKRLYMSDVQCSKIRDGNWSEFAEKVVKQWQQIPRQNNLEPVHFLPKKGTVLIWHENLLHGGAIRTAKQVTRRSIVSHYFANGSLIYFDSTGRIPYLPVLEQPLVSTLNRLNSLQAWASKAYKFLFD